MYGAVDLESQTNTAPSRAILGIQYQVHVIVHACPITRGLARTHCVPQWSVPNSLRQLMRLLYYPVLNSSRLVAVLRVITDFMFLTRRVRTCGHSNVFSTIVLMARVYSGLKLSRVLVSVKIELTRNIHFSNNIYFSEV